MSHRTGPTVGACLIGLLLLVAASLAFASRPVRLTNGDWAPYLKPDPPYGIVSRIVESAFAESDVSVLWGFFPWSRSYVLARDGRWDGSAAWSCSPERFREFYFSDALLPFDYVFFYRRNRDFDWQTADDLKGLRIGLTQNYVYGDVIQQLKESGGAKLEVATSDEINFRKLLAGRIDVFPMDAIVGRELLARQFSPEQTESLAIHPRVVHSANLYLLLSRRVAGNGRRMELFNAGLEALRQRGGIKAIVDTLPASPEHLTVNYDRQRLANRCEFDIDTVKVGSALNTEGRVSKAGSTYDIE